MIYKLRILNNFNGSFGEAQTLDAEYVLGNDGLVDFDFDSQRYIEEDYFVKEPRQGAFSFISDTYLKENFLNYDPENEISYTIESELEDVDDVEIKTRISKKVFQLWKDDEIVYTGLVEKANTKYDYHTITIRTYDFIYLISNVAEKVMFKKDDYYILSILKAINKTIELTGLNIEFSAELFEPEEYTTHIYNEMYHDYLIGYAHNYYNIPPSEELSRVELSFGTRPSDSGTFFVYGGVFKGHTSGYTIYIEYKLHHIFGTNELLVIPPPTTLSYESNNGCYERNSGTTWTVANYQINMGTKTLYLIEENVVPFLYWNQRSSYNHSYNLYTNIVIDDVWTGISNQNRVHVNLINYVENIAPIVNAPNLGLNLISGVTYKQALKASLFTRDLQMYSSNEGQISVNNITWNDTSAIPISIGFGDMIDLSIGGKTTSKEIIGADALNVFEIGETDDEVAQFEKYQQDLMGYYEDLFANTIPLKISCKIWADNYSLSLGDKIRIDGKNFFINKIELENDVYSIEGYQVGSIVVDRGVAPVPPPPIYQTTLQTELQCGL